MCSARPPVSGSRAGHPATAEFAGPAGGRLNQDIANAVVRRHKRFVGRGPTRAQAFFRHNFVVVVLEDSLTEAERRLVAGGHREEVLRMRLRYQQAMRDELVSAIEELTHGKVRAFLGGNHSDPDLAFALFVLDRPVAGERTAPAAT
jgi:uncharacterized protein YbcI